jgi:hypothetical protein
MKKSHGRLHLAPGGWRGPHSSARVAGGCYWFVETTALTRLLARSLCGNRECGLRLRTPPPALSCVFGIRYRVPNFQNPSTLARLVDWVSGRRLHSPLPQNKRTNYRVDAVAQAARICRASSVSQRTDARSTSYPTMQAPKSRVALGRPSGEEGQ